MKIRNGFVSNSSSSSFLIALPAEHSCSKCHQDNKTLLTLLHNLFGKSWAGNEYKAMRLNLSTCIENIDEEIKQLEHDVHCGQDKLGTLKEISLDKNALSLFYNWYCINTKASLRHWREIEEYKDSPDYIDEKVQYSIKSVEQEIYRKQTKISELKEKKDKLRNSLNDNQEIFYLEVGCHGSEYSIINNLIENGIVQLIEKEMK